MTDRHDSWSAPMPEELRRAIVDDLAPVVPLAPPVARAAWVLPLGVLLLVAAAAIFGVRRDAGRLGWLLTWGLSSLETTLGLTLVAAALREAVPGTTLSRRALATAFAVALLAVVTITWLTWSASPTRILRDPGAFIWRVCVGGTLASAFPVLLVSGSLVSRAFPLRPRIAGALCGLGAGLMSDAGWRIFCHFSDPLHVFGAHVLGVAVTLALGAILTPLICRR
jgi:hypothetical protein